MPRATLYPVDDLRGVDALKTCSFDGLYYEDVMRCPMAS